MVDSCTRTILCNLTITKVFNLVSYRHTERYAKACLMRLEELPKFLCLSCATSIVNDPMMVIHLIDFPGDSSHIIYAIAEGKKKKRKCLASHFVKSIVDLHSALTRCGCMIPSRRCRSALLFFDLLCRRRWW